VKRVLLVHQNTHRDTTEIGAAIRRLISKIRARSMRMSLMFGSLGWRVSGGGDR